MKLNNKLIKQILFILPLVLLVCALLVVSFAGFNKSIDFKTYYKFDVKFNTTLSQAEINEYKSSIYNLADANLLNIYSVEQINENINIGVEVKVLPGANISDETMESRLDAYKASIKNIDGINVDATITITNEGKVLPHTWSKAFWQGLLTIIVTSLVVFAFIWVRYEIKLALSYLMSLYLAESMIFSLVAILRLPVTLNFMIPYVITLAVYSVLFIVLFSHVRSINTLDKLDNQALITKAYKASKYSLIVFVITLCATFVCAFGAYSNIVFTMLVQCMLGVAVAIYALCYELVPLWAGLYNADKDTKLKNKLNKSNTNNDKLTV